MFSDPALKKKVAAWRQRQRDWWQVGVHADRQTTEARDHHLHTVTARDPPRASAVAVARKLQCAKAQRREPDVWLVRDNPPSRGVQSRDVRAENAL